MKSVNCKSDKSELPLVLTAQFTAKLLGINIGVLYEHLRAGTIPGKRIGRRWVIPRDALFNWLNKQ